MSFYATKVDELSESCRDRDSLSVIEWSPEAREDDPVNAWMVAEFDGLTLRLVRDRGREHMDLKCADGEAKPKRWVPLEVVAVAADEELITGYKGAFKATLEAAAGGEEAWSACEALMWETCPLDFVQANVECLISAASDAAAVRRTEERIAEETGKLLAEHARTVPLRDDVRRHILEGVNTLADAVKPKGLNVVLDKSSRAPTVLTEGLKSVAAGMNPTDLKRGIDKVVTAAVSAIGGMSQPCEDSTSFAQVGSISANSDTAEGQIIAEDIKGEAPATLAANNTHGIVKVAAAKPPGGGALVRCALEAVDAVSGDNEDQNVGIAIAARAMSAALQAAAPPPPWMA